jgi:hypothetical protein
MMTPQYAAWGRCRSGQRWFWFATLYDPPDVHGWADTEAEAVAKASRAADLLLAGRPGRLHVRHGWASRRLKEINSEKRRQRPPSAAKDSRVVEYLYGKSWSCPDDGYGGDGYDFYRFRITKRTAKRVFYVSKGEWIDERGEPDIRYPNIRNLDAEEIGFVDRQKLEADGRVRNRGRHWSAPDSELYASLEGMLAERRRYASSDEKPDLAALKAAMAAAHPDKGGSHEAFIEARSRYIAAKRGFAPRADLLDALRAAREGHGDV